MFKIVDPGKVVEPSHIDVLEADLGTKLPKDYRDFLQEYNGGFPEYEFFRAEGDRSDINLEGFCSIVLSGDQPNFREFQVDEPLIDEKFIAIAYDGCGNYLCMRKAGDNAGQLYFLDHDTDENIWDVDDIDPKKTDVEWCAFYKVHNNFSDLIAGNYADEEEEDFEDEDSPNEIWAWSDQGIVKPAKNKHPKSKVLPEAKKPEVFSMFSKDKKAE